MRIFLLPTVIVKQSLIPIAPNNRYYNIKQLNLYIKMLCEVQVDTNESNYLFAIYGHAGYTGASF